MGSEPGPLHVSQALSELINLRGYARQQGNAQLLAAWKAAAGEQIAGKTRPLGLSRGVLQIGVANAALLAELTAFHLPQLLADLQQREPQLRITSLRFRLDSRPS